MKYKVKKIDDLTISDYVELQKLMEDKNDFITNLKCLALFLGITYEEVLKLSPDECNEYSEKLQKQLNRGKLLNNVHFSCPKKLNLDGVDYIINYDVDKINMAQYIDFQMYVARGIDVNNINTLLSVFIIPKGKEYNDGYDVKKLQDVIYNSMPVGIASEISFFLKKRLQSSINTKLLYLTLLLKVMTWKVKDKEAKKNLKEAIAHLKNLKKQMKEFFSTIG